MAGITAASAILPASARSLASPDPSNPDFALDIAPMSLEIAPNRSIRTIAYNCHVPGPLLRFKERQPVTIARRNRTPNADVVHCRELFQQSEVDGAMEEGTPMIAPGGKARYTF